MVQDAPLTSPRSISLSWHKKVTKNTKRKEIRQWIFLEHLKLAVAYCKCGGKDDGLLSPIPMTVWFIAAPITETCRRFKPRSMSGSTVRMRRWRQECVVRQDSHSMVRAYLMPCLVVYYMTTTSSNIESLHPGDLQDCARFISIRYDTRCYFDVRSKADICPFNLPHGIKN